MRRFKLWIMKIIGRVDMGCKGCCMSCEYYERCRIEVE